MKAVLSVSKGIVEYRYFCNKFIRARNTWAQAMLTVQDLWDVTPSCVIVTWVLKDGSEVLVLLATEGESNAVFRNVDKYLSVSNA